MEHLLPALVGRDRRAQARARGLLQLGAGLLAEHAEQVGGPLQVLARRRVGDGEQAHGQADHDRVDPRLQERHPRHEPHQQVRAAVVHAAVAEHEDEDEHA